MPNKSHTNRNIKNMRNIKTSKKNTIKSRHQQDIINIIAKLSKASRNSTKSQSNLPARLMKLQTNTKLNPSTLRNTYHKSISSSYSRIMKNGNTHTEGKQIIDNSNKPFIEIDEMYNGKVQQFMIPRISKSKSKTKSKTKSKSKSKANSKCKSKSKIKSKSNSKSKAK